MNLELANRREAVLKKVDAIKNSLLIREIKRLEREGERLREDMEVVVKDLKEEVRRRQAEEEAHIGRAVDLCAAKQQIESWEKGYYKVLTQLKSSIPSGTKVTIVTFVRQFQSTEDKFSFQIVVPRETPLKDIHAHADKIGFVVLSMLESEAVAVCGDPKNW